MKNIAILFILTLISLKVNAVEYKSQLECKNGICVKKETFNGITGPDLKIENLIVGQCLFDDGKKVFYRIESVNLSAKRIVLLSEVEEEPVSITMRRDTVYTNTADFNVKLKIITCAEVNGQVINDESKFAKCLTDNGKRSLKLFCEKERKKNF